MWKEEEVQTLLSLRGQKKSFTYIGEVLGKSASACSMKYLNMKRKAEWNSAEDKHLLEIIESMTNKKSMSYKTIQRVHFRDKTVEQIKGRHHYLMSSGTNLKPITKEELTNLLDNGPERCHEEDPTRSLSRWKQLYKYHSTKDPNTRQYSRFTNEEKNSAFFLSLEDCMQKYPERSKQSLQRYYREKERERISFTPEQIEDAKVLSSKECLEKHKIGTINSWYRLKYRLKKQGEDVVSATSSFTPEQIEDAKNMTLKECYEKYPQHSLRSWNVYMNKNKVGVKPEKRARFTEEHEEAAKSLTAEECYLKYPAFTFTYWVKKVKESTLTQ